MSEVIQQQGIPQASGSWPGGDGGGGDWPRYPRLYNAIPASGPTSGGNTVLLTGSGLLGTNQVTFGGVPATIIAQDPSGNSVTVIAPAHAVGTVQVIATTPRGHSNAVSYTYTVTPPTGPTVTALVPASGPTTGGTAFAIIGTNLTGGTVTFNGVAALGVSINAMGTVLTGTTPPGPAGNVPVVVTTPAGSTTVAGGFTYTAPPPVVTLLSPSSGSTAGGTAFVVTGSNLSGASVTFNGVAATGVSVNASGTALVGFTPAGPLGNVPVVVTTPAGSTVVAGGYTYTAPPLPVVTLLSPSSGSTAGGTAFVVTGSNLSGASVTFNGVAATGVSVNASGTALIGFTPAGPLGNVPVVVTTPGGSTVVAGGYTYV
ncbi:IPT/TIG domain-containing protein [Streptomyces sp. Je 1-4]|uniref:IPT/TIG domain-containing protein n=1 Tax=Streptomyces TaxID=1883 RepID=UPI00140F0177|nr:MULTISPECIES: IPT/TIG domain-containing protein [unclassified Streptomyces]QIK05312.1 cell surface receptor IPT/TIG domain-containing protein [Streptomyces sp. ID38640]UYB38511.1 IPT/TIG domain-containing protein [Streptomyces sp. Je 1-4]UZQ34471.1 IPT/TIG domain-containing protein [Streptomyces sp. Je 1-4] [Streptomyces sp. Je 1-4 4N24]UZQ41889.1 IPT/TIG domain-containing protein [Streptomyces sp. Je 1-4] [Streptomyces sp. Je 1-4 4N24_ara]